MTSDLEGIPASELIPEAEPKPKARKKKAAKAESTQEAVSEAAAKEVAEEATDKPQKKARKPKAAELDAAEPEAVEPSEPAAKSAKKTAKKTKAAAEPAVESPANPEIGEEAAPESDTDGADTDVPAYDPSQDADLERLQKILAKAGLASRRAAEEMILAGRVQINGKVVTELGTKANPERDHIRVDGKLLQGRERIRYFVLNKPKGYVTTVSDPENRPTVMQFFAGERERLYPVGRLDYLSEGLLLVTNDGELANKLTKASSGVEKTYLVKVAGQPTEDMLQALREGVMIERGRPGTGTGRVRTAPAKIRQVRQGDNPWYEVIIIEGRNRELRKMFEEIGHHVEKIRRVGYGPLILDLEPGKLRELDEEEVQNLRLAAEGKLKTRRRRGPAPAQLPTVAGKTVRYKKADGRPGFEPRKTESFNPKFKAEDRSEFRPASKPAFKPEFKAGFKAGPKPAGRPEFRTGGKPEVGGRFPGKPRRVEPPVTDYVLPPRKSAPPEEFEEKPARQRSDFNPDYKPGFRTGGKPAFRREGLPEAGAGARSGQARDFRKDRPAKPFDAARPGKPFTAAKPARPAQDPDDTDFTPRKTPGFRIEPVEEKPRGTRPPAGQGREQGRERDRGQGRPFRPAGARPTAGGQRSSRPQTGRPFAARPQSDRPRADRPQFDRGEGGKPFRPRTDGPRTDRPRTERADNPASDRPFRPRPSGTADRGTAQGPSRGPSGGNKPFRPSGDRPAFGRSAAGRSAGTRPFTSRSGSASRPSGRPSGPAGSSRFTPRTDAPPVRRPKPQDGDAPREFRPRTPKRFDGPKPAPGGRNSKPSGRVGPDGQPRVKLRHRDSFTGKNKGRPKPKPKKES